MTTRTTDGMAPIQQELPLGTSSERAGRRPPGRSGAQVSTRSRRTRSARPGPGGPAPDDGERIDAHTRAVGRRGIAAARALLAASTTESPTGADGLAHDLVTTPTRSSTGRAA